MITLKRIEPSGLAVWSWRKAMEDGNLEMAIADDAITLLRTDPEQPLVRWEFHNGWIASLSFDGFVETMTIVHEGLVRAGTTTPSGPGTRGDD